MIFKKAKADVDYSAGKPDAHCGLCKHFRAPNRCALVKGVIAPNMWCKLFSPRAKSRV